VRNVNTIWEIKNETGVMVSSFHEKAKAGAHYFENLLKASAGCPIQKILEVVTKFQPIFSREMNLSLEEEVTEVEVHSSLASMQNGKSPGPDGFTV
jgi:hypothetical protein